jgi:tol-pal system protein YbgF
MCRILLFVALMATVGCSAQFEHIESAVDRNGEEIVAVQDQQRVIQQEVESIGRLLRADDDSGLQLDARLLSRIGQLETSIEQLVRLQEDNGQYMRNLSARVDLLTTRLGVPTLGEFKTIETDENEDDLTILPEEGQAIFDAAVLDRSRGNEDVAEQGFTEFLERYSRSELADEALYWLAEMTYARGDYTAALVHFDVLLSEYPEAEVRPDALMKAFYCHQELGQTDQAQTRLALLQTEFPDSEQAALATAGAN